MMVDIQADQEFGKPVTLQEIKENPRLQNMMVARRGMRLSIQPVAQQEWDEIVALGTGK
jgi:predicted RNA-binding protein with PUA-like domain